MSCSRSAGNSLARQLAPGTEFALVRRRSRGARAACQSGGARGRRSRRDHQRRAGPRACAAARRRQRPTDRGAVAQFTQPVMATRLRDGGLSRADGREAARRRRSAKSRSRCRVPRRRRTSASCCWSGSALGLGVAADRGRAGARHRQQRHSPDSAPRRGAWRN